jgi:hypothetical protein
MSCTLHQSRIYSATMVRRTSARTTTLTRLHTGVDSTRRCNYNLIILSVVMLITYIHHTNLRLRRTPPSLLTAPGGDPASRVSYRTRTSRMHSGMRAQWAGPGSEASLIFPATSRCVLNLVSAALAYQRWASDCTIPCRFTKWDHRAASNASRTLRRSTRPFSSPAPPLSPPRTRAYRSWR